MDMQVKFNRVSRNGRVYNEGCFRNIEEKIPIVLSNEDSFRCYTNLDDTIGYVSKIEENKDDITIYCNISRDNLISQLFDNNLVSIVPRGVGTINDNKEVEDYKLISFDIIPKFTSAIDCKFVEIEKGNA